MLLEDADSIVYSSSLIVAVGGSQDTYFRDVPTEHAQRVRYP